MKWQQLFCELVFTPSFAPLSGEILIYKLELGASSGHKNERVKVGNHRVCLQVVDGLTRH